MKRIDIHHNNSIPIPIQINRMNLNTFKKLALNTTFV